MCVCVCDNTTGMCHLKSDEVYTQHQSLLDTPQPLQLHFWNHGYMSCLESTFLATLKKWRCKILVIAQFLWLTCFHFLMTDSNRKSLSICHEFPHRNIFSPYSILECSVFFREMGWIIVLSRIVGGLHGTCTMGKMGIRKGEGRTRMRKTILERA